MPQRMVTEDKTTKSTAPNTIHPPDAQAQVRSWERRPGLRSLPSSMSAAMSAISGKNSVASAAPATAEPL